MSYGAYEDGEGINITRGYNKEHRKDLKQFKIGLVVNKEGFPLIGEILDGNLDDKTWNKQLLENLPENFTLEELKNIIYVADSALVTEDNLKSYRRRSASSSPACQIHITWLLSLHELLLSEVDGKK